MNFKYAIFSLFIAFLLFSSLPIPDPAPAPAPPQMEESDPLLRYIREGQSKRVGDCYDSRFDYLVPYFMGKPYVEKTLDQNDKEELVVNTSEFDCVTFVENMLAAIQTMAGRPDGAVFQQCLQKSRYYDGKIDGWESRIHYFSDWIAQAAKNGLGRDIGKEIGEPLDKELNFISSQPHLYPQMSRPNFIQGKENAINARGIWWVPKAKLKEYLAVACHGDVLALASDKEGLDVVHTGFAMTTTGRVHLLHASSSQKKVVHQPLEDYINKYNYLTGILVFRPEL